MNFVDLAHSAFSMVGGYVAVRAKNRQGAPFLLALPIAFVASAAHRAKSAGLAADLDTLHPLLAVA